MYPKQHIIFGFIFTALIYLAFPQFGILGAITIFLSSVLIDVDHYLYYVFEKREISLIKAYNWFHINTSYWLKLSREERNKHKGVFMFLHGSEILLLVFLSGYFLNDFFYFVLIGFSFHLFLDIIVIMKNQDRLDKLSVIHDYLKFRKYTN